MKGFGEAEDVGNMEWTKVIMEVRVHQCVVNRKEDCLGLWLGRLGEEC